MEHPTTNGSKAQAAKSLELFAHPLSSYCQKVLVALYENATPFTYRMLAESEPETCGEWAALWPLMRMPVLLDDGKPVMETSVIIEYLGLKRRGPVRLIPEDPDDALDVRFMDRVFDNYFSTPQQTIVFDALRKPEDRDAFGSAEARNRLDIAYAWLDARMGGGRRWAAGNDFSMADCAAAPALFYADWTHPFGDRFPNLTAYRERLLARPSFARAVDEGRPFRHLFPLGAPDRD